MSSHNFIILLLVNLCVNTYYFYHLFVYCLKQDRTTGKYFNVFYEKEGSTRHGGGVKPSSTLKSTNLKGLLRINERGIG